MVRPKAGEFNGPNFDEKGKKVPRQHNSIFQYWTNFGAGNRDDFEVVQFPKEDYWTFKTNLEPSDFDYGMSPKAQRIFLYKMEEIYRTRKVS